MAPSKDSQAAGKKRKRNVPTKDDVQVTDEHDDLAELERLAGESPKHYNNIAKIMSMAYPKNEQESRNPRAVTALCRVFYRLLMDGRLRVADKEQKEEKVVRHWLTGRLNDYARCLLKDISSRKRRDSSNKVKLVMMLVQGEVSSSGHEQWRQGIFGKFFKQLLLEEHERDEALHDFASHYFVRYEDVRLHSLMLLS
jgi:U3 small nucleolar RNA-associated protein 19